MDTVARLHGLGDFAVYRLLQGVHDVLGMCLVADKFFLDRVLKQLLLCVNLVHFIGIDRLTQLSDGAAQRLTGFTESSALILSKFNLPKDDLVNCKDEAITTYK